jgi:hypothetical protein
LAVVVAVDIDPTRRHQEAIGIQFPPPRAHLHADPNDETVVNGYVGRSRQVT